MEKLWGEFTKWVLIANIIAWPIAYYAMNTWLQGYAYRINIAVWSFVFAAVLALAIALFTVSYQAIRAATTNPLEFTLIESFISNFLPDWICHFEQY